jgi:uncharacterized membrane protein
VKIKAACEAYPFEDRFPHGAQMPLEPRPDPKRGNEGRIAMATFHVMSGADTQPVLPIVRKIGLADLRYALAAGIDDFKHMPSHIVFLSLIYPLVGIVLCRFLMGVDTLSLIFPLAAGFALVGPFAAVGLYEMSRRREQGLDLSWWHVFDVLESPSLGAILGLAILLMLIFLAWLGSAQALYQELFGLAAPQSVAQFAEDVLSTQAGWTLALWGNTIGFLFALWVLTISVVSFPLLLDRDVGAAVAVATSAKAVLRNPVTMAVWGLIVAFLLVLGSLPFFFGLAIVMPILGHASWHLYRRVIGR